MTGLLLVGGGGLAREVLAAERAAGRFDDVRVLDDDPARWGDVLDGAPVVGGAGLVTEFGDHRVLICLGGSRDRATMAARLAGFGVARSRFATSVHPAVVVPRGCTVGPGCILLEGVVLTANVRLGAHVVAMPHVTLTHDVTVEDHATLCAGVALGGGVRVGEAAYLGMRSSVREHVVVGAGATLGMGSVLLADLPDGEVWAGVPARLLARRTSGVAS